MTTSPKLPRDHIFGPVLRATLVIGAVAVGFAAWMLLAPVSSAVIAEGRFKVDGDVKTVQHLDGGIVTELMVKDGDRVRTGDALLRLDATDSEASLAALVAERDTLLARQIRLKAELDGTGALDFDRIADPDRPSLVSAIASQRAVFDARRQERAAETGMLNGTLIRLSSRLVAQRAELQSVIAQRALVQQDTESARQLAGSGLATRTNLNARERELASLTGADAAITAGIAETEAVQGEARLEYARVLSRHIAAVSKELSEVVTALAEIDPQIDAEEKRIRRARVSAPVDGIVVDLRLATIGGVVAPGEPILDIVPADATLIAEARLAPDARERLHVGMPVELRLSGVRARNESGLDGEIVLISAELTDDPDLAGDEDTPTYAVRIALAEVPQGIRLEPGMPVTSVIATEARTALEYLISPLTDAMARSMREN